MEAGLNIAADGGVLLTIDRGVGVDAEAFARCGLDELLSQLFDASSGSANAPAVTVFSTAQGKHVDD
jgi:hypothetical protein